MTQVIVKARAEIGMFQQQPADTLDFVDETAAQTGSLRFITQGAFVQLAFCLGMECVVHSPSRERSRSKTSGPGIPATFPSTSSR